jgi:SAM-dependent methyltransferase
MSFNERDIIGDKISFKAKEEFLKQWSTPANAGRLHIELPMQQSSKEYYKTYRADDAITALNNMLMAEVMRFSPYHVLEFGCGTGKHLDQFNIWGVPTLGIDISPANVAKAIHKYDLPCVICGDETYLRHFVNVDVVFTCSVLDHIENIDGIIAEFKRIANKAVILAETNDVPGQYYYPHDYESLGFTKLDYSWLSPADGANYHIWIWKK